MLNPARTGTWRAGNRRCPPGEPKRLGRQPRDRGATNNGGMGEPCAGHHRLRKCTIACMSAEHLEELEVGAATVGVVAVRGQLLEVVGAEAGPLR
jgi:hypothetical protein